MTAAAAVAEVDRPVTTGSRLAAVLRMNLVDARNRVGIPWGILAVIFVINLAIFWAVQARSAPPTAGTPARSPRCSSSWGRST